MSDPEKPKSGQGERAHILAEIQQGEAGLDWGSISRGLAHTPGWISRI